MQIEFSGTPLMEAKLNPSMMRGNKDTFSYLPGKSLEISALCTTNCESILLPAASPQIAGDGRKSPCLRSGDIAPGLKPCLAAIPDTNTAHFNRATR